METVQIPGDILCPNEDCSYILRPLDYFTTKTRQAEYKCDNCKCTVRVTLPVIKAEIV